MWLVIDGTDGQMAHKPWSTKTREEYEIDSADYELLVKGGTLFRG